MTKDEFLSQVKQLYPKAMVGRISKNTGPLSKRFEFVYFLKIENFGATIGIDDVNDRLILMRYTADPEIKAKDLQTVITKAKLLGFLDD